MNVRRAELLSEIRSLAEQCDAVQAELSELRAKLEDVLVDAPPLLGDCRRGEHLFDAAAGHCVKCGEPVDAYAAARKEAR